MRGITLGLMALLAMTGVAFGQVTLDYVVTDYHPTGVAGKTFTVQATGTGINILEGFTVTGDVYQVWTAADTMSEWTYNADGNTPSNTADSAVVFGALPVGPPPDEACDRLPDLPNASPGTPPTGQEPTTFETITGGGTSGWGTIGNVDDAYMVYGAPADTPTTVDLLQLVVPNGECVKVELTVFTAVWDPQAMGGEGAFTDITEYNFFGDGTDPEAEGPALDVLCTLPGDADENGIVNLVDLDIWGTNSGPDPGKTWQQGDFSGDGYTNLVDLDIWGTNSGNSATWYPSGTCGGAAAAVPEPGTIALLLLGGLCLFGYRLRK